jgi:hypothetical protein
MNSEAIVTASSKFWTLAVLIVSVFLRSILGGGGGGDK